MLSLKQDVVSFELQSQKIFNQGQIYVALSRTSQFENMHLVGKCHCNTIKVNQNAKKEYERLYKESLFLPPLLLQTRSYTLTLPLLNTRLYSEGDVLSDVDLVSNDVLCFTETQHH